MRVSLQSLSCFIILSLKKSDIDSKPIQLLMWPCLVSTEHLGSNASNTTNDIMLEKLNSDKIKGDHKENRGGKKNKSI